MRKFNEVPLDSKRFIDERTTVSLIEMAIRPRKLPICRIMKSVTHAAGSSIAGLVMNITRANIAFLIDQVDICDGEIGWETDFSPGKLVEHLEIANLLHLAFCVTMVNRECFSTHSQNIAATAFEKLSKKNLKTYSKCIRKARLILQREVIDKMTKLAEKISRHPGVDWSEDIRILLKENVRLELGNVKQRLKEIKNNIADITKNTKMDFDADVNQVWSCSLPQSVV